MKELENLVKPLQEWLINNYNPHCLIIIKDGNVKVVSEELSIPLEINDISLEKLQQNLMNELNKNIKDLTNYKSEIELLKILLEH